MDLKFETDYNIILAKLDEIDPVKYARTRNYVDGAVTRLSPYISRGVISTKQVLKTVLAKGYSISEIESFVKELCWRDYFQRIGQVKNLHHDVKQAQASISNYEISSQVLNASTGIEALDQAIVQLYDNGYIHNHLRMYLASLVCNIAKSYWHHPAQWMYYHLLDGDWASNFCSWQWVAGTNSNKKYYANQANINKYSFTKQLHSYLDKSYELLEVMETPTSLLATEKCTFPMELPETCIVKIDSGLPTFIYNYYNLDPTWHKNEIGNRILLIDPAFFLQYPVSKKCIDFMLALCANIPGIQIYRGSFKSFCDNHKVYNLYFKEHPLNAEYTGQEDQRDWIAADIKGYYPSFHNYWKKVSKHLYP